MKVWDGARIELATPGSAVRLAFVARQLPTALCVPVRRCTLKRLLNTHDGHPTIATAHHEQMAQGAKNPLKIFA